MLRLILACVACALAASAANAQPRMPSQEGYNGAQFNTADTRRSLAVLSKCLVRLDRTGVAALLATPPGSRSEFQTADRSRLRVCMELTGEFGQLALTPQSLRGPLAEAMIVAHYPDQLSSPIVPASLRPNFASEPPQDERSAAWMAAFRFAVCVSAAVPGDVAALFKTQPSSPEEKAVVDGLGAAMGACHAENATFTITRLILRSMLAEVSYQAALAGVRGTSK